MGALECHLLLKPTFYKELQKKNKRSGKTGQIQGSGQRRKCKLWMYKKRGGCFGKVWWFGDSENTCHRDWKEAGLSLDHDLLTSPKAEPALGKASAQD